MRFGAVLLPQHLLAHRIQPGFLAQRTHQDFEAFEKRLVTEIAQPGLGLSFFEQLFVIPHRSASRDAVTLRRRLP
jgi:hypothetical protein